MVLDLGGGTFDVTVLEVMEGVIEIQASAGDTRPVFTADGVQPVLSQWAIWYSKSRESQLLVPVDSSPPQGSMA